MTVPASILRSIARHAPAWTNTGIAACGRLQLLFALAALLGLLLMAGCGFHPAGSRPLPAALRTVYIELIDPYSVTAPPLQESLRARITRSGGEVKSVASEAETVLRLSELREGLEVLSIGPDGRAIEYRLRTGVTFELRRMVDGKAEPMMAPQTQSVSRDYSFNAQQILAKEAEEARLRRYIQDQLAELLLLRVEAALADAGPRSVSSDRELITQPVAPAALPVGAPAAAAGAPPPG